MGTFIRIAAAAVIALAGLAASAQDNPKYRVEITQPADGAIVSDAGEVRVRATTAPELAPGDRLALLLDGMPVAPPSTTLDIPLSVSVRGLHLLQIEVIDATGNVATTSPSSILYVRGDVPGISYSRDR
jgi:hypothetical protein